MSAPSAENKCIAEAVAGSSAAFARLVASHQQVVRTFLRRLTGNWAEADDLAQDVFLDAWLSIRRFNFEHEFKVWLCGIAYRKFLASRRSFWRRLKRDAAAVVEESLAGDDRDRDAWLDLRRAMQDLPIEQRAVLALCVAADWTHSETAQALGVPLGTVKSHVQRGRMVLARQLTGYALGNADVVTGNGDGD
jgi:RNA polymerase sigma-70 factor, ECF subfamily